MRTQTPAEIGIAGRGWTAKKLRSLLERKSGKQVSHTTMRTVLHQMGLSWKKCKKLLAKADPEQRQQYIVQLKELFDAMCEDKAVIIYIDEAHLHQDMDLGYGWSIKGVRKWVKSSSPGLSAKINWYGAYDFTTGRCIIWENGRCNSDNTVLFLQALAQWLQVIDKTVYIIMDGASWHRSHIVAGVAEVLGFTLIRLPAYSPDLNPIEGLWKWMREEVTQQHCHSSIAALSQACHAFIERINLEPNLLIKRLWPRFDLDPDFEKLLVSN